jgi:hypothetical protein
MQRYEQGPGMTAKDEDAELHRILAMTEEEFRAHIAAQGLDADTEVAKLKSIYEDEPMEQLENALFGASLDDIMSLSELADLETRQVGFVRRNQEANSAPLGPARPRRDHPTQMQHQDSAQTREPAIPSCASKKSN